MQGRVGLVLIGTPWCIGTVQTSSVAAPLLARGGYAHLTRSGCTHKRIKHVEAFCVSRHVHTQTIENFWSLVRRAIAGVYDSVSAKHLQGYLSEYVWRYNHRDQPRAMFLTLLLRAARP